jgi:NAD(P)-dependent dehydrogenase (short-subunit alcohol dehydrogenase family)
MPLCIVAAAGPGMGAAIARLFAQEGYDIALIARDRHRLGEIARSLEPLGRRVTTHSADLCALETVAEAFAEIRDRQGEAELLIYNGARWHERPAMALDPMDFTWDLSLCATGALVCAQHVYPAMKVAGAGTILFTGGGLALYPEYGAGVASLTAGKAALRGLTFAMAAELAPEGIHVGTVTIAGTVDPASPTLAPDIIVQAFWDLHQEPAGQWSTERVVGA